MSANLRVLINFEMILTFRNVALEGQSKVMVYRSLARLLESVLLA